MTYLKRPYDELDAEDQRLVDEHDKAEARAGDVQWEIEELEKRLKVERATLCRVELEADELWTEMEDRGLV